MSAMNAERTQPEIRIPAGNPVRDASLAGDTRAHRTGSASPESGGVHRPQRSFLPPPKARAPRPLQTGGQPPTVIRNLDALFAADQRRKSVPPAAPARRDDPSSGVQPIDRERFAQALLDKVQSDFVKRPTRAAFVVSTPSAPEPEAFAAGPALDPDDADLARLVPWYRRMWARLFGG